jgi:hypothetical protein
MSVYDFKWIILVLVLSMFLTIPVESGASVESVLSPRGLLQILVPAWVDRPELTLPENQATVHV